MAYENTSVAVSKSQDSVRKLILENGGTAVAFVSQPPMEGFEAMVVIDGSTYKIRISAEVIASKSSKGRYHRGVYKSAKNETQLHDEAARRVWRVLYFYLKSVYEAANSGVMDFRQLVMPYVVTRDNRTVGEHILPNLQKAVHGNPERMLPAPKD